MTHTPQEDYPFKGSAEWAHTFESAMAYYKSLTFAEQSALACVVTKEREEVEVQAAAMRAHLLKEFNLEHNG